MADAQQARARRTAKKATKDKHKNEADCSKWYLMIGFA